MLGGNMSYIVNNSNKGGSVKRKISFTGEDPDLNCTSEPSRNFKTALLAKGLISETKKDDFPKLYFKSTNAYTQIVAKPELLPGTPKIFHFNKEKEKGSDTCDSFLHNFVTVKTFNIAVSERFSNIMFNNNSNNKTKKGKKIKKQKVKKEKTTEEKLQRSIINKEKKAKKKVRKQKHKELMKLNELNEVNETSTYNEENGISGSNESKVNEVDLYRVVNKNGLIFHMPHPSKFSFHGEIKVTPILGEVEILGYTLNPSSVETSVDVYSPKFYTSLTIETKPVNQNKTTEEVKISLKDFLTEHDCNELLLKLQPNDCILYIEQIISNFGIVMNKYFEKQLFPKDLEDVSSTNETLKSLQSIFTFQLTKKGKHFRKNPQWDRIPLGQCTVFCGGKGVGKSTLLKYYTNKLVSLGEKVLCLDLDPGQPEFNFPGCVSAVIIDKPLLGPNFTHIEDSVVMAYFGDVDVTKNPNKYLECVKYIIKSCQQNEGLPKVKWFVNTMGFCKGLGVDLMTTILQLVSPDKVIQINSSDHKNNYPFFLTPSTVNSRSGYKSMQIDNVSLSYDLRVVYSVAELEKKQLQGGLKRRELRDVMSISYFSKMVSPPFYNFNAVQPYLISFSKLYLGIDFLIDPNDVLKAFNGNTVSLSHFEPDDEEIFSVYSEEDEYFKVVVNPMVAPSFGIGFVRGIDCKGKKFYVITHLPVETLDNVNCLSLGRVSPPHSMFLRQNTVEGETYYTTQGTFGVFQKVKRMFRVQGMSQNADKTYA